MKLFKIFGPNKPEFDPYWDFNKETHFRPKLNRAEFFKLKGFDFGWFVLEPIAKFIKSEEHELERTKSLSYGQKALRYWWRVDAEVRNGGFVQYYYNGNGPFVPTTIKSLIHIGEKEMADLIQRAEDIYQKNKKRIDKAREKDLFGSDLYDQLEELSELDDRYCEINKKTMSNIEKYIRRNPNEFCLDEDGNEFDLKFSGECRTYYAENKIKQIFNLEEGIINGEFKSFYENGQEKEIIQYEQGEPTGERIEFYENGNKKYSVRRQPDLNRFEHLWFYENGNRKKLEHKQLEKDERIGEYMEWYEDGQLAESSTFISHYEREGKWLKFFSGGTQHLDAEFKNGKFLIHNAWKENGEQTLKNGTGVYINSSSVSPNRSEDEYKNYKRDGKQLLYFDGILSLCQEMVDGKEHGISRTYYKNGKIKDETVYEEGKAISFKKYPKFENPRVEVKIKTQLCKNCYPDENNLQYPDNEPKPLNSDELERVFIADKALFEPYGDDHTLYYSYTVKTDKLGEVIEIRFLSADNMWIDKDIQASLKKLRFETAYKNHQPTECYLIVQHLLSLAE